MPLNFERALGLALVATFLVACAPMGQGPAITPAPTEQRADGPSAAPSLGATGAVATFPLRDKPWPQISFQELDGKTRQLSEFKGKAVLLVFFAYWCQHCQVELPRLQRAIADLKPANFVCVPIEASLGTPAQVREFATQFQITLPLYVDPLGAAYRAYNVRSFPTVFRLDADGTVKDTHTGELPPEQTGRFVAP